MSKKRNTGITDGLNGTFGTLATLPQQPKVYRPIGSQNKNTDFW